MQIHEFFSEYANTPIEGRFKLLDFNQAGTLTLQDISNRMHELEDEMRPKRIEQERLMAIAEKYWSRKTGDV
jgi:hypothetical protein